MKNYYAEVFVDERPIYKATVNASTHAAAVGRAMREAQKTGLIKRNVSKLVVRLNKLAAPRASEDGGASE